MRITGINKPARRETAEQQSFPECSGKSKDEAARIIKAANPNLNVVFVKEGQPVTMDWQSNRVRVALGHDGKVVGTPHIG